MTRTRPLFRQWFKARSSTCTCLLGEEPYAVSVRVERSRKIPLAIWTTCTNQACELD